MYSMIAFFALVGAAVVAGIVKFKGDLASPKDCGSRNKYRWRKCLWSKRTRMRVGMCQACHNALNDFTSNDEDVSPPSPPRTL